MSDFAVLLFRGAEGGYTNNLTWLRNMSFEKTFKFCIVSLRAVDLNASLVRYFQTYCKMAEGGASQGFDSPKMNPRGARDTDSLFRMSDASASAARENDEEFRQVKDNFLRVARQHRRRELSRRESSRSPSPIRCRR